MNHYDELDKILIKTFLIQRITRVTENAERILHRLFALFFYVHSYAYINEYVPTRIITSGRLMLDVQIYDNIRGQTIKIYIVLVDKTIKIPHKENCL